MSSTLALLCMHREFPAQELMAYTTLHNLQTLASPTLATLVGDSVE